MAGSDVAKPSTLHGLTLEAWAEGFCVGALIIMAGITVSNMRRGVLLHKLILIEVRSRSNAEEMKLFARNSFLSAYFGNATQYLYLPRSSRLRLVSLRHGNLPQHILEHAQRDCVDEEQAVSQSQSQSVLHRDRHISTSILGGRDICELHLLQQHQQSLPLYATL